MPDWILEAIAALQAYDPDLDISVVIDPEADGEQPCLLVRKPPPPPAQLEH